MGNSIPGGTAAWSVAVTPASASAAQGEQLVGTLLAERYEIIALLGQGGMGAVYKAHDIELERMVAIKLIRPDLASNPEILRRFKQELILAREVTHRNVIRIFDLGQSRGLKFITMEFVEGRDLRALLRERGKLPPEEAVRIISQVCRALESAHAAGVVHRDLKPQNIMLDPKDRVYVMDFGIAHSLETPGMTQTGALMGTPEYMSPEQAKGIKVDARSDLFALGIILYELLTGISPYKADNALAMLLKRTQERPQPPAELDPTIPKPISDVVMKCLEIDRDQRFSNAREILEDLGLEMPTSVRTIAPTLPPPLPAAPKAVSPFLQYRNWIIGGAAVLLFATLGFAFRSKIFPSKRAAVVEQASLAILPFRNASGDASLDWLGPSLADMLSTDVGQSARLRTISPDRLHQVLSDLKIASGAAIDPTTVSRIAEFSSADTIVWGQYAKFGDQIRIDATILDLKRNRRAPLKIEAANEKEIPGAVDGLAELIRKNLAVSSDVLKELKASSFQPSSKSVPALRDYNQGVQLFRDGKNLEAVKMFQAAIQEDSQFALAYSRLGQADTRLGYDNQAGQASRRAVGLSDKLPPQERYLIRAIHSQITKDYSQAIEAYENLAKAAPGDFDFQFTLGGLYEDTGAFDKARNLYSSVVKAEPKNAAALLAMGRMEINTGNPQGGLDYLNQALSLTIALENDEERAKVLQALGVDYQQLSKPNDALNYYQQSLDIKRRLGQKRGIAESLHAMAQVQDALGRSPEALKGYQEALRLFREIEDTKDTGDTLMDFGNFYLNRGQNDQALQLSNDALRIERAAGDQNYLAICLNNVGAAYFNKGDYDNARIYYEQALDVREKLKVPSDTADTIHNLAEVLTVTGQYDQAVHQYLRSLDLRRSVDDKKGTAQDSYSLGILFGYQGRYGAALNAKQEALKTFQGLQERSYWLAEILSGYGEALVEAGRGQEAEKSFSEAFNLARDLKNQSLLAQTFNYVGDSFFYQGDVKSAQTRYEQALPAATLSKDRSLVLLSKFNLAKAGLQQGRSRETVSALKGLAEQADASGQEYLSVAASLDLARALIDIKDYPRARQELERALGRSEKMGLRTLQAKAHYLLGALLRLIGKSADASTEYQSALKLLEQIRAEPGAEKVLERDDLKIIYTESTRWSKNPAA